MELSGQLNDLATLFPGKELPVYIPIVQEARWTLKKKIILCPLPGIGFSLLGRLARSLVAALTELPRSPSQAKEPAKSKLQAEQLCCREFRTSRKLLVAQVWFSIRNERQCLISWLLSHAVSIGNTRTRMVG